MSSLSKQKIFNLLGFLYEAFLSEIRHRAAIVGLTSFEFAAKIYFPEVDLGV